MNQWRNTQEIISWFKGIKSKDKSSFTKFDIVDFYLPISKDLLTNAINFASTSTTIDKKVIDSTMHSRNDGGRSHVMDWEKIDNTYRKNNNESTC